MKIKFVALRRPFWRKVYDWGQVKAGRLIIIQPSPCGHMHGHHIHTAKDGTEFWQCDECPLVQYFNPRDY